jgi:hypothetical protein
MSEAKRGAPVEVESILGDLLERGLDGAKAASN